LRLREPEKSKILGTIHKSQPGSSFTGKRKYFAIFTTLSTSEGELMMRLIDAQEGIHAFE